MDQLGGLVILVLLIAAFGMFAGGGRSVSEQRMSRRWESSFDAEIRQTRPSDATGVLRCRHCGASGSERAGRCPSCGALL